MWYSFVAVKTSLFNYANDVFTQFCTTSFKIQLLQNKDQGNYTDTLVLGKLESEWFEQG